jgi:hypothetical protein
MSKKIKITTVFDGKTSQKLDIKGSISINETEILEKIYDVVDALSENVYSKSPENGGRGIKRDDFVQDTLFMIEDGGKLQVNITIN